MSPTISACGKYTSSTLAGGKADVNDLVAALRHQERRLFHGVVADGDDEVGTVDGAVDVVAFAQGRGAEIELRGAADRPLAHLGVEEGDPHPPDEVGQRRRELRAAGAGAEHQ